MARQQICTPPPKNNLTRRAFGRLLALTGIGTALPASAGTVALTKTDHEAEARRHLWAFMDAMKKARPEIRHWTVRDDLNRPGAMPLVIFADTSPAVVSSDPNWRRGNG